MAEKPPPNTINDQQWTSLQRRRAQAQGKEDWLSKKAADKRISYRQQKQRRHSN